ncbi:MAG: 4-hydroxy-3-methylbut-2-enyl diphosphate reductase, partial [Pseudoflavonifractor sp.]
MSRVTLAEYAGFCYGVRRAVKLAEETADARRPCVMLGHLIHNDNVIERLREQGIGSVASPEDVPTGTAVIIRSHGEPKAVYDTLTAQGTEILDATCPNVSAIHRIAAQAEEEGRQVVIIGTPNHPEVTAIAGWCRHPAVLKDAEALAEWLDADAQRKKIPLTMVSQTTSTQISWNSCVEKAKKVCTNLKVFDTICSATYKRQLAAQKLAAVSEAMIVIGDRKSSNTRHLAELCAALCPTVVQIERAAELEPSALCGKASVGITAGASTP